MKTEEPSLYLIARKALPLIKEFYEEEKDEQGKHNITINRNDPRTDSRNVSHQCGIPAETTVKDLQQALLLH